MGAAHVQGAGQAGPLLSIYDDYVEFQESCAFFLDAIASMISEEEPLDRRSVMGVRQFCQFLKERGEELRRDMEKIQQAG